HAIGAERELPMTCHHIDAEQLAGVDHVLTLRPQRRRRALPRIATIEQQRVRTARLQLLDECREMRKTAKRAVSLRCGAEIEVGERMRIAAPRWNTEMLQQRFADEMRWATGGRAKTEIDARLAKIGGQKLRVTIGEMQHAHVAETRDGVER